MARTPEKLVELYLKWKTYAFPEWSRGVGIDVQGVTTQDPATRAELAQEGRGFMREMQQAQRKGKTEDIDIELRLCIDDGEAMCSRLEARDLGVRELIELVAPDQDEAPWTENARWIEAARVMPRALARAEASGPWIRDLLHTIADELKEAQITRDPARAMAAKRARRACNRLAKVVGKLPVTPVDSRLPENAWSIARTLVGRDRRRLEVALANASPGLLPEAAMLQLTEDVADRGRILGLAEGWRDALRRAVERAGWVQIPDHRPVTFEIMPESRTYTAANLRNAKTDAPVVQLAVPANSIMLPATIAHETYPGHMLQKAYQNRSASQAMKLLGDPMSDEGWAHYAEMRIQELGMCEARQLEVGLAQRSLLRSVRFMARVGLVTGRMDERSNLRLFRETAMMTPETAQREATRVQWDGKTVDYALGRLALERMENEFVGRGMGDAVEFRHRVLPIICAPLDMVARRLGLRVPDFI